MEVNKITERVISAAIEVHKALGPGLLESAYKSCLAHELTLRHLSVAVEPPIPLVYKNVRMDCAYRMDIVVEEQVIVEVKCATKLIPVFEAQILSYMKMTAMKVGLLINFHEKILIHGLRRFVN